MTTIRRLWSSRSQRKRKKLIVISDHICQPSSFSNIRLINPCFSRKILRSRDLSTSRTSNYFVICARLRRSVFAALSIVAIGTPVGATIARLEYK